MPAGVEIATGGGDTLAFPQLEEYLVWAKGRGLIVNMTVNAMHLYRHAERIRSFRERGLVYGVGISYGQRFEDRIFDVADANTVVHVIAGVDSVHRAIALSRRGLKILVLGYKRFGRGVIHFDDTVERKVGEWRYWTGTLMRAGGTVSFDNLAIEQLDVRGWVTQGTRETHYLGADGSHTMYIDAVRMAEGYKAMDERRAIKSLLRP